MYSYVRIMFSFCMHQNFSVTPSAWPVFPPTTQKTLPHHTQSFRCRTSVCPSSPLSSWEIKRSVAVFDHYLRVYHCGVSAIDQSSRQAQVAQFTKISSWVAEQNRVLLQPHFDWETYFRLLTRQPVLRNYSPTTPLPKIFACISVDILL